MHSGTEVGQAESKESDMVKEDGMKNLAEQRWQT